MLFAVLVEKVATFNCTMRIVAQCTHRTHSKFTTKQLGKFIQTNDCIMQFIAFKNILIWLKFDGHWQPFPNQCETKSIAIFMNGPGRDVLWIEFHLHRFIRVFRFKIINSSINSMGLLAIWLILKIKFLTNRLLSKYTHGDGIFERSIQEWNNKIMVITIRDNNSDGEASNWKKTDNVAFHLPSVLSTEFISKIIQFRYFKTI